MAADLATFREWFAEFASTGDDVINRALEEAKLLHNVRVLATLCCAAHLVWERSERAAGRDPLGEIMSEGAGPLRAQYTTMVESGDPLARFATSSYGRRFISLEKRAARSGIGAAVVGG